MSRALYVSLGIAIASLAILATTTTGNAVPKTDVNSLAGKIVIIPPMSDSAGAETLYYENCRIEIIGGRNFFVAEKISVGGEKEKDRFHIATGVVDYVPWDRIAGFMIWPPNMLDYELGRRMEVPKRPTKP